MDTFADQRNIKCVNSSESAIPKKLHTNLDILLYENGEKLHGQKKCVLRGKLKFLSFTKFIVHGSRRILADCKLKG